MRLLDVSLVESILNKKHPDRMFISLESSRPDPVVFKSSKARENFINETERIVRGSMEYKDYIEFCKRNVKMKRCAFFKEVRNDNGRKYRIEIHHEPFDLFSICDIVINRHMDEGIPLDSLMVAKEVMWLHYRGLVGLIPLSKTIHQMVHNGAIFIPLQIVYGNYAEFFRMYEPYMNMSDSHYKDLLETKVAWSTDVAYDVLNRQMLERSYTYIDQEGYMLPTIPGRETVA